LRYEKKIDDLQKHLQTLQNQFENSENLRKETEADLLKLRKEVEFVCTKFILSLDDFHKTHNNPFLENSRQIPKILG